MYPASRRLRAAAGWTARFASNSTPADCRHWGLRPCRSTSNCGRSTWTPRAGAHKWAAALSDSQIIGPGGKSLRLRELADVHDGVAEVRTIARLNGRQSTTFGVFKAKGASDVAVAKLVQAELDKILKENSSVRIKPVFTTVDHTLRTYHSAIGALIEGSILAVAVVWFFLRSARATVISAL